jgi:hypothetical protein
MQFYTDPTRANDPHALPNAEVFQVTDTTPEDYDLGLGAGFYWQPCFPGCLPDADPIGPFATEAEAIQDAQE